MFIVAETMTYYCYCFFVVVVVLHVSSLIFSELSLFTLALLNYIKPFLMEAFDWQLLKSYLNKTRNVSKYEYVG